MVSLEIFCREMAHVILFSLFFNLYAPLLGPVKLEL